MAKATQCEAVAKSGERCRMHTTVRKTKNGYRCIVHDPARADVLKQRQRLGGYATSRKRLPENIPPAPQTAGDAVKYAAWLVDGVMNNRIDSKRADVARRSLDLFIRALEREELEGRVRELEAKLRQLKAKGRAG